MAKELTVAINSNAKSIEEPATAVDPASYPGMSPLKAALLYGGAAGIVGGPLGLLVGLGAGITAKKQRDNFLDKQAAYRQEQVEFNRELANEMDIANPEEARLLQHAKRVADAGWQRLAAGDPTGREMIENANAFIAETINGDRAARQQEEAAQTNFQRGLIGDAAQDYRKQYQTHVTDFESVDAQVTRLLDLTADPNFDPNKPVNKAVLTDLISSGIGGFYRDSPDMLDGVAAGVSGLGNLGKYGGTIGGIIEGLATAIKSKDFKVSREEYNRIAFNMRKVAQQATAARMERLSGQAAGLDEFARKTGAIPFNYSLKDFISGGTKELRILNSPAPKASTITPPKSPTPTRALSNSNFILNQRKVNMTRPVN
jgi:hypothetical protein